MYIKLEIYILLLCVIAMMAAITIFVVVLKKQKRDAAPYDLTHSTNESLVCNENKVMITSTISFPTLSDINEIILSNNRGQELVRGIIEAVEYGQFKACRGGWHFRGTAIMQSMWSRR